MATVRDFRKLLLGTTLAAVVAKGVKPGQYSHIPVNLPRLSAPAADGDEHILYVPTLKQQEFHASTAPNCILEGSRGTGKSKAIRNDAHMRALAYDGFIYLILRRTTPELRKSHLLFIKQEMEQLGGYFNKTEGIAYYPNGSQGHFSHCEQEADVMKLLSSEFGAIYFDEITTFTWEMVTKIAACARVPEDSGLIAIVRGGTNPIGEGAADVKKYYINHSVRPEEDPDYIAEDYVAIHTTLDDNPHIDRDQYIKRLKNLPPHIRRAWLNGEWLTEGMYFADFMSSFEGEPWHVIQTLPTVRHLALLDQPWINIYRALDWGYAPDPAVCLWIAILPNGEEIVFKERSWKQTLAADVAKAIKRESEGMRVLETFADPSMFAKRGETVYSVGELIEQNGIPLTASLNDRALFGYSIHDHLNTLIDERPKLKILANAHDHRLGCPDLIRTIAEVRSDEKDARKIANGEDHWVCALAYYCIGQAPASRDPVIPSTPRWMQPKRSARAVYGLV